MAASGGVGTFMRRDSASGIDPNGTMAKGWGELAADVIQCLMASQELWIGQT